MDAGELDRRITLQRLTETDDGYGTVGSGWSVLASVWAKIIPVSGQEILAAAQNSSFSLRRFKVRKSSQIGDLSAKDRLLFDEATHNITDVRPEGRGFLIIDAVMQNDG